MNVITLMTDFGLDDPYIAIMKGILLSSKKIVQIVVTASFFLSSYYKYFPEETVNIIVVDPNVGNNSTPILSIYDQRFFLAPDNGILTPVLGNVYKINFRKGKSNTFFGRDVYAPFALKIIGNEYRKYLEEYKTPLRSDFEKPKIGQNSIKGKVIHIDRFGNIITNIKSSVIKDDFLIKFKGKTILIYRTYSDVKKGDALGLINSFNLLEISVNLGNASRRFNGKVGDVIYLIRRKDV